MNFVNKKVLVCGMARSGQAAASLLNEKGAIVTVQDISQNIKWGYDPQDKGMTLYLGKNPDDIVNDFDLIIVSPGLSIYLPFIKKAMSLGIPVWGEAELAFRLCPCPIIGITGTNGKTTVTTLVGEIMKLHNPKTVVAGNIGIPLTSLVQGLTPDSLVVAEISSFQLETIVDFRPNFSAVLNMTEDHLDRHNDMETYIKIKSNIFINQRHPDIAVLNYDNNITREMKPNCHVVWFSEKTVLPWGVYQQNGSIYAKLDSKKNEEHIIDVAELTMMTENALAATALTLCAGVSPVNVANGLRAFKPVLHRLEHVVSVDGVDYINDSKATNVDAAVKAINSIKKPIILIGGGYDKNTDFAPWVDSFGNKVVQLILIGQTATQIMETCDKKNYTTYRQAADLYEAVEIAAKIAIAGQVVLLSPACASMDMFKDFEDRGDKFREYVKRVTR